MLGRAGAFPGTRDNGAVPRASLVASAVFGTASLLWAARLGWEARPLSPGAGALLAVSLLVGATVAIAGLLVAGGRWARRFAMGMVALQLVTAVVLDPDSLWVAAVAASLLALAGLFGPWPTVRRLPRADGPPARAVLIPLVLVVIPAVVALTAPRRVTGWGIGLAILALVLAGSYARAWSAALWVLRLAFPLLALPAILTAPRWGGTVLAAAVAGLVWLAWSGEARLAIAPLVSPPSAVYPIPPELTPPEILDAAGLDRRGRRTDR